MNAPAPPAPKDGFSTLLLLGGLGLAALAVVKLDGLLQDLESRVWRLEARGARTVPRPEPEPEPEPEPVEDAKPAGAEYSEELVNATTVTQIRPAVKTTRSRTVRTDRTGKTGA